MVSNEILKDKAIYFINTSAFAALILVLIINCFSIFLNYLIFLNDINSYYSLKFDKTLTKAFQ